jgi:predicted Zn-dependent protease
VQSQAAWKLAVKEAGNRPAAHLALARYALTWGWDEQIDQLWNASKGSIKPEWAVKLLYQHYDHAQSAAGMYRALARATELMPDDLAVKNNYAYFGALLGIDVDKAASLAEEVYKARPENADFRSTYAFALLMQGHSKEGLELMRALSEDQLKAPSVATCYGELLAEEGLWKEAPPYLEIGKTGKLLQEEQRMVENAEAKVRFKAEQAKLVEPASQGAER